MAKKERKKETNKETKKQTKKERRKEHGGRGVCGVMCGVGWFSTGILTNVDT
jgi:hypothetical protein